MNVTVYLGANPGNDPSLGREAEELGRRIARGGHTLVYGGSKSGLMGLLAKGALEEGGAVIGVEPRFFVDRGFELEGLTRLIVTETMAERRTRMIELGDAFVAFPGGTGTLEEIAEVMSAVSLGRIDALCILYDRNGYYGGLRTLLKRMIADGLSSEERQRGILFAKDLDGIVRLLEGRRTGARQDAGDTGSGS